MPTPAKRALGAILALVGLALCVVGIWFTVHLGTSGRATFTLRPAQDGPVLIGPDVVNRLALPVTIRARASGGSAVWIGVAAPTDARSAVGTGALTVVDGVSVRDWALLSSQEGSGAAPELVHADLWRQQNAGAGQAAVTVVQASAPETVVVTADGGKVDAVTLSVEKKTWFVQSLLAALSGLLLAVAGVMVALTAGKPPARWESFAPGGESRREAGRAARRGSPSGPEPSEAPPSPSDAGSSPSESDPNPTDAGPSPSDSGRSGAPGAAPHEADTAPRGSKPAPRAPDAPPPGSEPAPRASGRRSSRSYQPRRAAAKGEESPR